MLASILALFCRITYASFPTSTPVLTKGDGDGTVNARSLLACTKWGQGRNGGKAFHHKVFPGKDHAQVSVLDDRIRAVPPPQH